MNTMVNRGKEILMMNCHTSTLNKKEGGKGHR